MRELVDDYMEELRHMKANAPYVPALAMAIAIISLLAFSL